jgi:N-methylhydantoinase B
LGIDMQVRNLVDGHWNFEQTKRTVTPPWGMWGGTPGESGAYLLRLPDEKDFSFKMGARLPVPVGASAIVRTGGGGGWGDPCERDPAIVASDVREQFISRDAARQLYGVVVRDDFSVDVAATTALRNGMQTRQNAGRKDSPGG